MGPRAALGDERRAEGCLARVRARVPRAPRRHRARRAGVLRCARYPDGHGGVQEQRAHAVLQGPWCCERAVGPEVHSGVQGEVLCRGVCGARTDKEEVRSA